MIVKPKIRGFICTTAHPEGCKAQVKEQIDYIKSHPVTNGAKKVLVIGASMGYGLASRITAAFSNGAATIGVIFDKPANAKKTATSGWYNTAAFEEFAAKDGLYAKTVNGDAYSQEVKDEVIKMIKNDLGKVDMVIYSLAAPRRTDKDGNVYNSVLKTTNGDYTNKTIDLKTRTLSEITITSATDEEIHDTVKVMGGEDWKEWIQALTDADAIEKDAVTVAFSYIGPSITHPMYFNGSIGRAKAHLYKTADEINAEIDGIKAYVAVNKALVTQSSAAIPIVPLYTSILYKVMKAKNCHEGCIEQMHRLFSEKLFNNETVPVDEQNRIRIDDWEMREDVQSEVLSLWEKITDDNINECADIDGYWDDFYKIFGFNTDAVNYDADVDIDINIPSIS